MTLNCTPTPALTQTRSNTYLYHIHCLTTDSILSPTVPIRHTLCYPDGYSPWATGTWRWRHYIPLRYWKTLASNPRGNGKGKGKSNPITGLDSHCGFQQVEAPRFQDNWHMKVVRLSALCTACLYPPRKYSWYSFLLEAESTAGT